MNKNSSSLKILVLAAVLIVGLVSGFFIGKGMVTNQGASVYSITKGNPAQLAKNNPTDVPPIFVYWCSKGGVGAGPITSDYDFGPRFSTPGGAYCTRDAALINNPNIAILLNQLNSAVKLEKTKADLSTKSSAR